MKYPFKIVALVGKFNTPEITKPLLHLAAFLSGKGITVVVDAVTAGNLGQHEYRTLELAQMENVVDLAIVLGGDGTLLNVVRTLAPFGIPLVGVNQGRLGFLTDVSLETMEQTIGAMLEQEFITEQRLLLSTRILRGDGVVFNSLAFNEVVVHRDNVGSMIEFEVRINDDYLYHQRADGLIVASPTGSTAYALSSGGPILHPSLDVIELVPVCPHTLSNRPIVVKSDSVITILLHGASFVRVRFDGHSHFDLQDNDRIEVSRYPKSACLLHPVGHSYYHTLREKLLWNKSF